MPLGPRELQRLKGLVTSEPPAPQEPAPQSLISDPLGFAGKAVQGFLRPAQQAVEPVVEGAGDVLEMAKQGFMRGLVPDVADQERIREAERQRLLAPVEVGALTEQLGHAPVPTQARALVERGLLPEQTLARVERRVPVEIPPEERRFSVAGGLAAPEADVLRRIRAQKRAIGLEAEKEVEDRLQELHDAGRASRTRFIEKTLEWAADDVRGPKQPLDYERLNSIPFPFRKAKRLPGAHEWLLPLLAARMRLDPNSEQFRGTQAYQATVDAYSALGSEGSDDANKEKAAEQIRSIITLALSRNATASPASGRRTGDPIGPGDPEFEMWTKVLTTFVPVRESTWDGESYFYDGYRVLPVPDAVFDDAVALERVMRGDRIDREALAPRQQIEVANRLLLKMARDAARIPVTLTETVEMEGGLLESRSFSINPGDPSLSTLFRELQLDPEKAVLVPGKEGYLLHAMLAGRMGKLSTKELAEAWDQDVQQLRGSSSFLNAMESWSEGVAGFLYGAALLAIHSPTIVKGIALTKAEQDAAGVASITALAAEVLGLEETAARQSQIAESNRIEVAKSAAKISLMGESLWEYAKKHTDLDFFIGRVKMDLPMLLLDLAAIPAILKLFGRGAVQVLGRPVAAGLERAAAATGKASLFLVGQDVRRIAAKNPTILEGAGMALQGAIAEHMADATGMGRVLGMFVARETLLGKPFHAALHRGDAGLKSAMIWFNDALSDAMRILDQAGVNGTAREALTATSGSLRQRLKDWAVKNGLADDFTDRYQRFAEDMVGIGDKLIQRTFKGDKTILEGDLTRIVLKDGTTHAASLEQLVSAFDSPAGVSRLLEDVVAPLLTQGTVDPKTAFKIGTKEVSIADLGWVERQGEFWRPSGSLKKIMADAAETQLGSAMRPLDLTKYHSQTSAFYELLSQNIGGKGPIRVFWPGEEAKAVPLSGLLKTGGTVKAPKVFDVTDPASWRAFLGDMGAKPGVAFLWDDDVVGWFKAAFPERPSGYTLRLNRQYGIPPWKIHRLDGEVGKSFTLLDHKGNLVTIEDLAYGLRRMRKAKTGFAKPPGGWGRLDDWPTLEAFDLRATQPGAVLFGMGDEAVTAIRHVRDEAAFNELYFEETAAGVKTGTTISGDDLFRFKKRYIRRVAERNPFNAIHASISKLTPESMGAWSQFLKKGVVPPIARRLPAILDAWESAGLWVKAESRPSRLGIASSFYTPHLEEKWFRQLPMRVMLEDALDLAGDVRGLVDYTGLFPEHFAPVAERISRSLNSVRSQLAKAISDGIASGFFDTKEASRNLMTYLTNVWSGTFDEYLRMGELLQGSRGTVELARKSTAMLMYEDLAETQARTGRVIAHLDPYQASMMTLIPVRGRVERFRQLSKLIDDGFIVPGRLDIQTGKVVPPGPAYQWEALDTKRIGVPGGLASGAESHIAGKLGSKNLYIRRNAAEILRISEHDLGLWTKTMQAAGESPLSMQGHKIADTLRLLEIGGQAVSHSRAMVAFKTQMLFRGVLGAIMRNFYFGVLALNVLDRKSVKAPHLVRDIYEGIKFSVLGVPGEAGTVYGDLNRQMVANGFVERGGSRLAGQKVGSFDVMNRVEEWVEDGIARTNEALASLKVEAEGAKTAVLAREISFDVKRLFADVLGSDEQFVRSMVENANRIGDKPVRSITADFLDRFAMGDFWRPGGAMLTRKHEEAVAKVGQDWFTRQSSNLFNAGDDIVKYRQAARMLRDGMSGPDIIKGMVLPHYQLSSPAIRIMAGFTDPFSKFTFKMWWAEWQFATKHPLAASAFRHAGDYLATMHVDSPEELQSWLRLHPDERTYLTDSPWGQFSLATFGAAPKWSRFRQLNQNWIWQNASKILYPLFQSAGGLMSSGDLGADESATARFMKALRGVSEIYAGNAVVNPAESLFPILHIAMADRPGATLPERLEAIGKDIAEEVPVRGGALVERGRRLMRGEVYRYNGEKDTLTRLMARDLAGMSPVTETAMDAEQELRQEQFAAQEALKAFNLPPDVRHRLLTGGKLEAADRMQFESAVKNVQDLRASKLERKGLLGLSADRLTLLATRLGLDPEMLEKDPVAAFDAIMLYLAREGVQHEGK